MSEVEPEEATDEQRNNGAIYFSTSAFYSPLLTLALSSTTKQQATNTHNRMSRTLAFFCAATVLALASANFSTNVHPREYYEIKVSCFFPRPL